MALKTQNSQIKVVSDSKSLQKADCKAILTLENSHKALFTYVTSY